MPSLGADMDVGTVIEWRVAPGDHVHRGDIVAVVDTEKSDIEIEIFQDGVITELLVPVGTEVAVGTPLARVEVAAEATQAPSHRPQAAALAAPTGSAARTAPAAPSATASGSGRVRMSPLARRRAGEQGVDLGSLVGSGPGGAIVAADVARGAPVDAGGRETDVATREPEPRRAPTPGAATDRRAAMRHAIGELMARSKREIPHYHLATTIDMGAVARWLSDANSRRPVTGRVLPAAVLLKAVALAARDVPAVNGLWVDGFQPASAVHLGVAVSLRGGGLIAPAIHDADRLTVDELMAALRDVVERARSGRLRSSEMTDAGLTVTNLGEQGADEVYGVIYPPQVALVGFGRIVERPWASDGMLAARPTVRATLAADHRVSDGHEGSRFLAAVDRLLQSPEAL
jgi:pyruvate dehydrogenase E2 component (dihydrolipoamide acetyltransferase)